MKRDKDWLLRELKEIPHEFQDGYLKAKAIYVLPLIDQLDEPERVIIPQFVADEFDYEKRTCYQVDESKDIPLILKCAFENPGIDDFLDWVRENPEDYVMAVRNGYEVEKESLYYVIIPTKNTEWKYYYLDCDGGIDMTNHLENVNCHTEYFIRSISDDLWTFAVEVAE